MGGRVIGPSGAPVLVRMGDMDSGGKEHVEGLGARQRKGFGRRQPGLRVCLRDIEKDGRVLGQDPVWRDQGRDAPLGIDRQKFGPVLLAGGEIDMACLERGAGVIQQDMRRVGAGFAGVIKGCLLYTSDAADE